MGKVRNRDEEHFGNLEEQKESEKQLEGGKRFRFGRHPRLTRRKRSKGEGGGTEELEGEGNSAIGTGAGERKRIIRK